MKIGIEINAYPCSIEEQLILMKKHGFESTFCFSLSPQIEEIMELCEKYGITVENYHAPFTNIKDLWLDTPEGDTMLRELTDSIDVCKKYGVDTLVTHLGGITRIDDFGLSRIDTLMAYARENGVTLAFENLSKLSNLAYVFEEYEDAGFCWDTGHEKCYSHGRQYMPLFGSRLAALHVHDNFCVHMGDRHMIPYDATIDFDRVAAEIAKVNYQKSLMLEVMAHRTDYYVEMGADAFYERAANAAKRLSREIESKKISNN